MRPARTVTDALLDIVLGSHCVGCAAPGRLLCPVCAALLPTVVFSRRQMTTSLEKLAALRAAGTTMIYGHDPDNWRTVAQAMSAIEAMTIAGPSQAFMYFPPSISSVQKE